MPTSRIKTDASSVYRFVRAVRRARGKPRVEAYIGAAGGRSAAENADIVEEHARKGRDPWHLDDRQAKDLQRYAIGVCDAIVGDRFGAIAGRLTDLGRFMLKSFDKHFEHSESANGRMTPNTAAYAERKRRAGDDPRPMIRKGHLRRSVKIRVSAR